MNRFGWLVVLCIGCASSDEPSTRSETQAITEENGIWENGLATNGIWENGIWENGIWENGIWENGIWENGIWENGIWENGIWENGLWQQNPTALDTLRTNPYTRKVMQYVFSCAVPPGRSKIIDPGRTGACITNSAVCVHDSECPTDDMCLGGELELEGGIGVGINQGASTADWDLPDGTCDLTCQRWVSACLLARTNAYGVHVHISMRAPDDAPQAIKDALVTSEDERLTYTNREGSYYGNIFGAVSNAPLELFACAGPDSNIPEITNRFCSSQGDNGPIEVTGTCLSAGLQTGVCASSNNDPNSGNYGGIGNCAGHNGQAPNYHEVITVFLADPIAVCGNNVCEGADEEANCLSDCHPGTWGSAAPAFLAASAIDPADDTIVRVAVTTEAIDLGNGVVLPATPTHSVALARYAADGTYLSSRRVLVPGLSQQFKATPEVIVAPDRSIYIVGHRDTDQTNDMFIIKLNQAGDLQPGWPHNYGGGGALYGSFATLASLGQITPLAFSLAVGPDSDLYVVGRYEGPNVNFGGHVMPAPALHGFVMRVDGTTGAVPWAAASAGGLGVATSQTIYVDNAGSLWITRNEVLEKRSASTGALLASKSIPGIEVGAIREDSAGNFYISGAMYEGVIDFGDGIPRSGSTNQTLFVASYLPDFATVRWVYQAPQTDCDDPLNDTCQVRFSGYRIGFDQYGQVVVGGMGGGTLGGTIDLGAGPFSGYGTMDIYFLGLDATTGNHVWAKHVPLILRGVLQDVHFASDASVIISGFFAGSMNADGKLLVSSVPEDDETWNGYLASFRAPAPDDLPPVIGHVPRNIKVAAKPHPQDASKGSGAHGWFNLPTATDSGFGGTNVHCDKSVHEWLPVGVHTVNCTAWDASGNAATTSFTITVADLAGPKFSNVPADITSGPAIVAYVTPTAIDAIDGARPVSCAPASGSAFPPGLTTVTCTASDASGNTTGASFKVNRPDVTPPVVTVPSTITTTAASAAGSVVTFTVSANDNFDGPVPVTCDHLSGSVFPLGDTTVHCSATDQSGNTGHGAFQVIVGVSWSNVLQPVNADGSSIFKLGRTVPVKFQLTGASSGITNLEAHIFVVKLSNGIEGTIVEATSTIAADTGNTFRYSGGHYMFNLSTDNMSKGTWRMKIDLGDGVTHDVNFSVK